MSLLEVKGIVCGYGGKPVLNGLSLTADRGLLTGVIGPNGSGKSTLIKAVSGLLSLSSGEICLGGRRLCNYTPRALACCLAVLAQDIHIEFEFTVREIVAMGRHPFLGRVQREGLSDKEITERAMVETDTLHLADRSVTTISGGERQRVLLARALAQQAELLLLDEPTSHLDSRHQVGTARLLRHLAAEKAIAVLGVFHDLNLAARICDRLLLLCDGHVLAWGTPEEVLTPDNIYRTFGIQIVVERSRHSGALLVEML
ncbi:MAG: ABC transporter ATP-binding protein [bacterium]|nr:ABC transporter ATP-binding protein [bacterium]